jgi:ribosome recycling factor
VVKDALNDAEDRMKGAIHSLEDDLSRIRTGRASPALVEKLSVEYYGTPTPLQQLASISVPEPRSLLIKPYDGSALKSIERAILASDLGLTPNNDGKNIRLNIPALTQERRREYAKMVHNRAEQGRVAIRNIRRDVLRDLHEFEKEKLISEDEMERGETEMQKLTDRYIEEINRHSEQKEKEIMEI